MKSQTNLGIASDLVIQKSDLTVKAVIVKSGFFNLLTRVAAASDIVELNSGSVILNNDDSITTLSEATRIREAIHEKMHGVHQSVRTKSGKALGQVYDYTIDNATCAIQKLYIKSLLSDRIIPVSAIINFEGKRITVKDDFEVIAEPKPEFKPEVA
jgi:uncharacterized protein YrrD